MQNIQKNTPLANNHISVDCVVIGFDGEQLKVLLVKRAGEDNGEVYHDMKLPGSLIYMDEDLDEAAQRVLYEVYSAIDPEMFIIECLNPKYNCVRDGQGGLPCLVHRELLSVQDELISLLKRKTIQQIMEEA